MVKAQKSFSILMVLALALSLGLAATLCLPRPVNAQVIHHVTTAAEFQAALDTAENNGQDDVIYLDAGTYLGNFVYTPLDTEHKSLTIMGEPGTTASDIILDGQDSGTVLYFYTWSDGDVAEVIVSGITVQNGNASATGGGGINATLRSYNISITNCVIKNNSAERHGGGIRMQNQMTTQMSLTLEGNLIMDNTVTEDSSGVGMGGGVAMFSSFGSCFIRNNAIVANTAQGPTDPQGGGLLVGWPGSDDMLYLVGNTIYDNQANSGGGVHFYGADTANVYNNIIYGNTGTEGGDIYLTGITNRIGYNNDYSDMQGDWTEFGSNIDADPAFVDPASYDYHLTAGSPCIDAGTTVIPDPPGLPATDIEGNPRVWGTAPDMGAYEWAGGAPPPPAIGFSPPSFSFFATEGGANPADQTLEVWNSGADTLDWSITDDADWPSLSPETGSSTGPADVTEVTVSVDISGMTNGSYNATITISDPAAINSPQMVPVNLTINPAGDQDNPDVATGLDSISDCLVVVYGFDNASKTWSWYNPSWPPEANTLTTLYMGSGYWINVSEGCDFLTYGANTYDLYEGWNLIGWLGW